MKYFLVLTLFISTLALAQRKERRPVADTIYITTARLHQLSGLSTGDAPADSAIGSKKDKVSGKYRHRDGSNTVQMKLSKYGGAFMNVTKTASGEFIGRIIKDSSLYYELQRVNDTLYRFVKQAEKPYQNCVLGGDNPTPDLPVVHYTAKQLTAINTGDSLAVVKGAGVIFLDTDGGSISGTSWNYGSALISYAPASFYNYPDSVAWITNFCKFLMSPFDNVVVTSDSSLYWLAPSKQRIRVCITPTWDWYGTNAGGVSYNKSYTWGDNTPSWVFQRSNSAGAILYKLRDIATGAMHEAGHALGLMHQSAYSNYVNGSKTNEYRGNQGNGNTTFTPIMGFHYGAALPVWSNGPNPNGVTVLQDDIKTITSFDLNNIHLKPYLEGSRWHNGKVVKPGTYYGYISYNDSDSYKLELTQWTTVTLTATADKFSAMQYGTRDSYTGYTMLDLGLAIYSAERSLIAYNYSPTETDATMTVTLPPGTFWISVKPDTNQPNNPTGYGFVGKYSLTVSY